MGRNWICIRVWSRWIGNENVCGMIGHSREDVAWECTYESEHDHCMKEYTGCTGHRIERVVTSSDARAYASILYKKDPTKALETHQEPL